MNIVVRKDGAKWGAFFNDKRVASSACKSCVIKTLLAVTKKSEKYTNLVVEHENGVQQIIPTGAAYAGQIAQIERNS